MAPLLLLLWLGSGLCAQELVPRQCLLGPEVLCRDPGLAAQCGWQQKCKFLEQHKPQGWRSWEDAPAIKCSLCTKIMKKLQSLVGDDRDEDTISQAEDKVCQRVGRMLRRLCRYAIKKFKAQITQALEDGQDAKGVCTSLRMCRGPAQGLCAQELVPRQCLLGPEVLCRDPDLAAQCGWQQKCKFLEQHKPQGWRSRVDAPAFQCSLCTKIMKTLESLVGDKRDKDTITQAEDQVCQIVAWVLQGLCRYAIKMFKSQITQALEDGKGPRGVCTSLGMCRGPAQGALLPPRDACDLCLTFTSLTLLDLEPSRDLGDALNSTCKRHFGGSPGCDTFVSRYGARLLQALREPWDPLATCLDAEACQLPEEPAQGEPSSGTDMWAQL